MGALESFFTPPSDSFVRASNAVSASTDYPDLPRTRIRAKCEGVITQRLRIIGELIKRPAGVIERVLFSLPRCNFIDYKRRKFGLSQTG